MKLYSTSNVNQAYERTQSKTPEKGMGATILIGNNRYPATIIGTEDNAAGDKITLVVVQEDTEIYVGQDILTDPDNYEYERNPDGEVYILRAAKDGVWRTKGRIPALLGRRMFYENPED